MKYAAYDSYKETSTTWLGQIPRDWKLVPLKYLIWLKGGGTPSMNESDYWNGDIPWVTPKDMTRFRIDSTQDMITAEGVANSAASIISSGAMMVVVRSGILKHTIPIAINTVPVTVNQDLRALLPNGRIKAEYLAYLIHGYQTAFLALWSKIGSTVDSIEVPDMKKTPLPVPPLDEQDAIIRFIDRETAKIDRLIEKKRRLIELLKEKRTAIISHAVTKGLDPNVPMKDSGIDWIDKIPEHWGAVRIADTTTKLTNGWVGPTRDILDDEGTPYVQSLHIKRMKIVFTKQYFVKPDWLREHQKAILRKGDVVIVQTGDIGQVAVVDEEFDGAGCHALIIARPASRKLLGDYLAYLLDSDYGYHSLKRVQTGALHPHLNCTFVREIPFGLPPIDEQRAIVELLKDKEQEIQRLIDRVSTVIDLLQERRSALISSAVTGKIDVRELV